MTLGDIDLTPSFVHGPASPFFSQVTSFVSYVFEERTTSPLPQSVPLFPEEASKSQPTISQQYPPPTNPPPLLTSTRAYFSQYCLRFSRKTKAFCSLVAPYSNHPPRKASPGTLYPQPLLVSGPPHLPSYTQNNGSIKLPFLFFPQIPSVSLPVPPLLSLDDT